MCVFVSASQNYEHKICCNNLHSNNICAFLKVTFFFLLSFFLFFFLSFFLSFLTSFVAVTSQCARRIHTCDMTTEWHIHQHETTPLSHVHGMVCHFPQAFQCSLVILASHVFARVGKCVHILYVCMYWICIVNIRTIYIYRWNLDQDFVTRSLVTKGWLRLVGSIKL